MTRREAVRILLTGRTGQVGRELEPLLAQIGAVNAYDRQQLDLADADQIRRTIRDLHPHLVVNAAAYTAVDRAETDEPAARAINAAAPGIMAEEAKRAGALLIHYSTDYVFDGTKQSPYLEDDPKNPVNVYGKTKLEGERAIERAGGSYLIFRTSWVYAPQGRNFLLTVLRLATERDEIRIVDDQVGAPTSSRAIAAGTIEVLSKISRGGSGFASAADYKGVYHMTAAGQTTWYQFAKKILELARSNNPQPDWLSAATRQTPLKSARILPIASAEYSTPARRPGYSVLANDKLRRILGVELPDWQSQLRDVFSGK